jgi:hypothetical protein
LQLHVANDFSRLLCKKASECLSSAAGRHERLAGRPGRTARLEHINLIADPAKNFKIIMKGGTIHKSMLTT